VLSLLDYSLVAAVVQGLWGHEANSRVVVFIVIPIEEGSAKFSSMLDASELFGEGGLVLESAELAFGIRIVIGNLGSAVRLCHSQVREE
jgi:hypothetical protein